MKNPISLLQWRDVGCIVDESTEIASEQSEPVPVVDGTEPTLYTISIY
jgi:hypothetical protein